jgi:sigma-B regulation protein RsbU (phosphoserine phosphatase)
MRTSTGRYNRRYFIFVPLVTVALLYHLAYSSTTIATYLYGRNIPKLPVLTGPSGDLTPNSDYAISAGIHKGDQLLAVNGRPATTVDSVSEAMRGYQVGDAISLTIRSVADGKQRTISFPLEPERPIASTAGEWVFRILVVLIALLSVGLSSYVLLRLPGDPVAIWLFGSLAGLTQLVHTVTLWEWPRWALVIGGAYSIFLQGSFQVWMMLFGIYFPERSKWDIKRPWLKYLLIVPLLVANVVYTVIHLAAHYRFVPAGGLLSLLESVDIPLLILASVAQALFFVSIFPKIRTAKSRDAQRRLRLVGFGSVVSLTPPFLMFLYVVLFHRGHFEEVPGCV